MKRIRNPALDSLGDRLIVCGGTRCDRDRVAPVDKLSSKIPDDGFLIDTITVTNHFLGRDTGIEEIAFSDGTSVEVEGAKGTDPRSLVI